MVLVDTSVWIDHFKKKDQTLISLLENEEVALHPFILGELACGNLQNRKELISLFHALPFVNRADDDEILFFIERHGLMGRGVGLVDVHLLASCHMDALLLWTKDKRLRSITEEMKIGLLQS